MKPPPFRYLAPRTLDEVQMHLSEHGFDAKLLAGGQSLIPAMNFRLARPSILIDLNGVAGLDDIQAIDGGGVRIGAMARQSSVEKSRLIVSSAPMLAAALPYVAHTQIRNRGTVGGSLAHADPAAELPAVMVALDAIFVIRSLDGKRKVRATDFYQGLFTTDLGPEEILVEMDVPAATPNMGWAFREVARRHGDYAMAGVASRIVLDEQERCTEARLVFFGIGEGPARAYHAEQLLHGQRLTDDVINAAVGIAVDQDLDVHEDMHASSAYRKHLARILGRDALIDACAVPQVHPKRECDPIENAMSSQSVQDQPDQHQILVTVNGQNSTHFVEARLLLSDFIRHTLGFTGTHVGCEHGSCGACTILFDGHAVRSCIMLAVQANGHSITTIEGVGGADNALHPVQEAFHEMHGLQCGFCTPGFVMTLLPYLEENPTPTEADIRAALSGNICRCTGYENIVRAALLAAELLREEK